MELLVAADDRTGAFETAAALADRGIGAVPVTAWPSLPPDDRAGVVDLGSRHESPGEAAARAAALPSGRPAAHKIDSTLRGNWPDELVARAATAPVLLVPALPSQGRTCRHGVVLDHGRPVHEGAAGSDVRRRVLTSRPAEALRSAGAGDVVELADRSAVERWLSAASGLAVADAVEDRDIDAIADAWRASGSGTVLAGTSRVIAGTVAVCDGGDRPILPPVTGPILAVCGSVHPVARSQIEFAEHRGVPVAHLADSITARSLERAGALVLVTEIPTGDVDAPMAIAAAAALARGVADLSALVELGALVVIGGDTATAVFSDTAVTALGSVGPGTAWVEVAGFDMPVVARSGGFGTERDLFDLLQVTLR